jgi:hypothetical protein
VRPEDATIADGPSGPRARQVVTPPPIGRARLSPMVPKTPTEAMWRALHAIKLKPHAREIDLPGVRPSTILLLSRRGWIVPDDGWVLTQAGLEAESMPYRPRRK